MVKQKKHVTLEELKDKAQIYYLKGLNSYFGTVALIKHPKTGVFCRGVALCSENDPFNKNSGRVKALGRLRAAVENRSDSLPIRKEKDNFVTAPITYLYADYPKLAKCGFKSVYDAELSKEEKKMVGAK